MEGSFGMGKNYSKGKWDGIMDDLVLFRLSDSVSARTTRVDLHTNFVISFSLLLFVINLNYYCFLGYFY